MEPLEAPISPRIDGPSPFKRPAPSTAPAAPSMGVAAPTVRLVTSVPPAPPASPASPATAGTASAERQQIEAQSRRGALWFYWIAGLSLVNSVVTLAGLNWRFIIGLGMSQIVDTLATRSGRGLAAAILFDALLIGGFVLLGHLAVRGHAWAFLVGVTLYALDGLISLLVHDWLGVGFHVFVVILILKGFQAARQLGTRAT